MARTNDRVEQLLLEYADLLAILGEDPFKPRAYEKAARAIAGFHADLEDLDRTGILSIPSVGKSIAEKVEEALATGTFAVLEELRARVPTGVRDMMSVPGLGPKKAMLLHRELGIGSIEELAAAAEEGRLAGVPGLGKKTEENLLRGIGQLRASGGRAGLGVALDLAETVIGELRQLREVRRIEYAGSLRRMAETIGDVDLLVASDHPAPVMDRFTSLPLVDRVLAHGETKSSIVSARGLQIDLRVVPREVWGAAMVYFTGSKAHNIRIREIAVRKGLKLSEYGLFRAKTGRLIVAETEQQVYERLGLPWIPPTLREDRGEVEAALAGELPRVIEVGRIRGDLHTHTDLSDGVASLEEMLEAASRLGYAYFGVTDHAPQLAMQRMTEEKIVAQRERLRALQDRFPKMALLHGTELNIGPEGEVDWPAEFLESFDLCVASIHSHFDQPKDAMTRRLLRAMEDPYVHVIGHPTARLIGRRSAIEFDHEEVFAAAARTGTALEVNGHPDRLDLKDEHILWARRHGVRFAVDTDAHATRHLRLMRFGVGTAQRGWLSRDDVINAWPLGRLRRFLGTGQGRR